MDKYATDGKCLPFEIYCFDRPKCAVKSFLRRLSPLRFRHWVQTIKGVERVATPSTLFYAENAAILPLWVGMVVFPEEKLTKTVMASYLPVVAAAVVYFWLTYECFQNPVSLQGFASGITNLPGLTKGFGEEVSVATAWSHFLAEDLFLVGLTAESIRVSCCHILAICPGCMSFSPKPIAPFPELLVVES